MSTVKQGMRYAVEDGTEWITRYKPTYERVQVPRYRLDQHAFADDLAKALDGTVTREDNTRGQYKWVRVHVDGMAIHIGTQYGAKADQFCLGIDRPRAWHDMANFATAPKLPDICVSSQRPIAQVAADIRRRLIEPAKAPLAAGAAKLAEYNKVRDDLQTAAAELKARFPSLQVTIKDNATSASVWNNGGAYLSGTLYSDGALSVERIESLNVTTRNAVLKALFANSPKQKEGTT